MKDKKLEKEAEKRCSKYFQENCYKENRWADTHDLMVMYLEGYNKTNGWHDLRKDSNDVPFQEKNEKWHIVLDNFGNKCFYDNIINKWRRLETLDIIEPTAWCEVPKYTEE